MSEEPPIYSPFFGAAGAAAATILCSFGAGYATAKSGTAISAAGTRNPAYIMKTLLPTVMAGIISVYGLVASVLILNSVEASAEGYTEYKGYLHFGAGFSVGFTGLAAGYAIGIVGAYGVRAMVKQPGYFIGMVLILIFSEVLGLYGLILGLILTTKE